MASLALSWLGWFIVSHKLAVVLQKFAKNSKNSPTKLCVSFVWLCNQGIFKRIGLVICACCCINSLLKLHLFFVLHCNFLITTLICHV